MRKRTLSLALAISMAAMSLAGCGGGGTTTATTAAAGGDDFRKKEKEDVP